MPTTISGLVLFIILMIPGLVYLDRIESRIAGPDLSVLRETGKVISVSVCSETIVLICFGIIQTLCPEITPDVEMLVHTRETYFVDHFALVLGWAAGLLAASTILAAYIAVPSIALANIAEWLQLDVLATSIRRRNLPVITPGTGWDHAFREPEPGKKTDPAEEIQIAAHIQVHLKNGPVFHGWLGAWSSSAHEDDDRSLQLTGPIRQRIKGAMEVVSKDGTMVISAGEIQRLQVDHINILKLNEDERPLRWEQT